MEVNPTAAERSLVSAGQPCRICKMKGEAAVGYLHRGMERSGCGPSTNTRLIVQVQGNGEWRFRSVIGAAPHPAPPPLSCVFFPRAVITGKRCLWQSLVLVSCFCNLVINYVDFL